MHKYKVKVRLAGRVSWLNVNANDSAHATQLAKSLLLGCVVLQTKRR
jgi:hypothetical protein